MSNFCQSLVFILCFYIFINPQGYAQKSFSSSYLHERKHLSKDDLEHQRLNFLSEKMDNLTIFYKALQNILIPRVVGSENHTLVQNYIINEFNSLGWFIEEDSFKTVTPIGTLPFKNIIASHNPEARSFLDIACHYDSKYYPGNNNFVGATDSAVPCAMMVYMAHVLNEELTRNKNDLISLRFVFFDGEEAFKTWSRSDSIYGSRHLAGIWKKTPFPKGGPNASQLDRIDLLVLLDLLGAKNPEFYSFFRETKDYYTILANAETQLSRKNLLRGYSKRYFLRKSTDAYIEDDHLPFLENGVPILHLITIPFPKFWHTPQDNENVIDTDTTANLMKIISVFIREYLQLS